VNDHPESSDQALTHQNMRSFIEMRERFPYPEADHKFLASKQPGKELRIPTNSPVYTEMISPTVPI